MKIKTKQQVTIPDGVYTAVYEGVEETESQYGPRYRWSFILDEGPFKGKKIARVTGQTIGANACGAMVKGLGGDTAQDFEEETVRGGRYNLKLSLNDRGYADIDAVWPASSGTQPTRKQFAAAPKTANGDQAFAGLPPEFENVVIDDEWKKQLMRK